jgi:hypothetical protein
LFSPLRGITTTQVDALRSLVPTLQKEIGTITETAETRRLTLNEFAKEKHDIMTAHAKDCEAATTKHAADMAAQVTEADNRLLKAVAELRKVATTQEAEVVSLEANLLQVTTETTLAQKASTAALEKTATAEAELAALTLELQAANAELGVLHENSAEAETCTALLQTEVADLTRKMTALSGKAGDQSIVDRKSAMLIKDLRKQLNAEQKRLTLSEQTVDDLRFRASVTEVKAAPEVVAHRTSGSPRTHRRTSSNTSVSSFVSSASNLGSKLARSLTGSQLSLNSQTATATATAPSSSLSGLHSSIPMVSPDEHTELIHRVSRMQSEKAEQSEVIKHLQHRVRNMGEDLQLKSELIARNLAQGHVQGGSAGHSSSPGSSKSKAMKKMKPEALMDINNRLQTMLEETLMKNIQLERMVEALSALPTSDDAPNDDEKVSSM